MGSTHAIGAIAQPSVTTAPEGKTAGIRRAAEEFESVFLAQMLRGMAEGLGGAGGPMAGGDGDPFRSMMVDEYGRLIGRSGGIGIADLVMKEMLKMQEAG